jgi:hypothetical protein
MQKLSFSEMMQKAGIAAGGLRKTLAVYGFDTDKMLDSVKAEKKSESGDTAVVTVSYTLLDTPVTADVNMIKRDGRWYSADLVKSVEDSLAKPAVDTSAPPMASPEMSPPTEAPGSEASPSEDASAAMPASEASEQSSDDMSSPASDASNGGG